MFYLSVNISEKWAEIIREVKDIFWKRCIESNFGKKVPREIYTGAFSYNLFGIKGKGEAGSVSIYTHEYVNG